MRTAISGMAGVCAGLLVGACFDPTRPCSTSADCVNGGTCDPGTKTCVSAGNPNDKTPPTFSLIVAAPSPRQNTTKLTELDPGSPDGGLDAFRRDESITVTVSSKDQDVDGGSVKLRVFGIATGPVTPADVPLVPCAAGSPGASDPFCREGSVALATLPFEAFRGVVVLEASGSDLSNNLGTADAGVNVTRWKWRYSAGAPIYTTPAIADDGTIVFGTSDGGSGSLYALTPAGEEKWAPVALGPIKASPVIGAPDGGQQLAYVGLSPATSGNLLAITLQDGSIVTSCPNGGGSYLGPFVGTPALVLSGSASFEGVLAIANGTKLVNIRPSASLADDRCVSVDTVATQGFPANLVASGSQAFAAGSDGNVRAFARLSGIWLDNVAWGGGTGSTAVSNRPVQGLALTNRLFGTTRLRGGFELERGTGVLIASYPDGGLSSDPGGPVVLGAQLLFTDGPSASPSAILLSDNFSQGTQTSIPDAVTGSPVAGAGDLAYLLTTSGILAVQSLTSGTSWSGLLNQTESFSASPTLDCKRSDAGVPMNSEKGVLYVGSTSGSFFSVVVDSSGLSATAPWPKYQHDVRNTGNPTTPIQPCP